jgi:hypothetical protein
MTNDLLSVGIVDVVTKLAQYYIIMNHTVAKSSSLLGLGI